MWRAPCVHVTDRTFSKFYFFHNHTTHILRATMKFTAVIAALGLLFAGASALDKPLDIDVLKANECTTKTKPGTRLCN